MAQSTSAETAGIGPLAAQVPVAVAETELSLEPARIWTCVVLSTPVKARPTGSLVLAVAVSEVVPSGVPAATSK